MCLCARSTEEKGFQSGSDTHGQARKLAAHTVEPATKHLGFGGLASQALQASKENPAELGEKTVRYHTKAASNEHAS